LAPNPHERADFEDYEYPGRYLKSSDGESYARLRLEELNARYEQARGRCNARGLSVGSLFNPTGLPVDSDNREYLLTASCIAIEGPGYESQEGGQDGETFRSTFAAIASKCPFRTERSAPRPTVPGPQTATVVGQAGEEIWTDKYGRVKVQFHWDREGQRDENSSCWVRVAQVWAGKQWGAMHIPRIGQEVIVDFLEGDPDKPIITGRVYNADNMPPYTLPENRTQSGIKSRSSKGGSPSNFNEIRFEDLKGKEELHIQAEKDLTILVKNDEMRTVGHDRTKTVENDETSRIARNRTEEVGQDEEIAIHGNRTETVDKDENITITGNRNNNVGKDETITITGRRTETVGKDETISITGKRVVSVDKDENLTVAGSRTQSVAGNDQLAVTKRMILDVGDEFVIKAGAASLSMKKDGTIVLKGVDLAFKASGKIDAKASGEVNIKGSKVGGN
jgi:type VI secretion system secreted protein VgrG